ncbi:MAG TPA: ABC transporter ATP-binding protein, partial [Candidatus Omnitrophica bacterium]|nr:ABC transporter ATP-binding protein [Candidatus Omnitrophota bacterium]
TGLLRPTTGKVYVGEYDVEREYREAKKLIGYVSDHPYLYEKLTGEEFLKFISELYGVKNFDEKIQRQLDSFELLEWKDRLIEDYSHGMRQKLAIISALIHDPQILIIDEPLVALDPKSARYIKKLFKKKTKEGITIFLSTHMLSLAEEVADRIGIINHGRLVFLGNIEEIRKELRVSTSLEDIFLKITEEEPKP